MDTHGSTRAIHYKHLPQSIFQPAAIDRFSVFKQLKLRRVGTVYSGGKIWYERLRASRAMQPLGPRAKEIPPHFDAALVIEDPTCVIPGTLNGLRLARVRVIFELPPQFGLWPHPLAYIEWYTSFQRVDPTTGMYVVSRSTRNHRPNAAVVSVDRIHRYCHLIGKSGSEIPQEWTSNSVLDLADTFFVNKYFSLDFFSVYGM